MKLSSAFVIAREKKRYVTPRFDKEWPDDAPLSYPIRLTPNNLCERNHCLSRILR